MGISKEIRSWEVLYTRSKHEKKVDLFLKQAGIESFCPIIKKRSQWVDRVRTLEVPLFTSYVFAKVTPKEELILKQTSGVMHLVNHCGKPVIIKEDVINNIRIYLQTYSDIEAVNLSDLNAGRRVKIKEGLFYNQEGEIIRIEGKKVLMVLEALGCIITTKVLIEHLSVIN